MRVFNSKPYFLLIWLSILPIPAIAAIVQSNLKISISGVNVEQEKNIGAQLSLAQKNKIKTLTPAQVQVLHERAEKEILRALQPYGYYHATVEGKLTITDNKFYNASYKVTLGKPTVVGKISTHLIGPGKYNPKLFNIFDSFELKPNHVLNHSFYEKDKAQVLSKAIHQGYLHAYYSEHQVLVDLSKNTADIALTIDSGPLFTFGSVNFHSDYFATEFLNRFIPYKIGAFYEPEQVAELEAGLSQSLYFKEVTVVPHIPTESNGDNTVVPIEVNLVKNRANQYLLGFGYDTDTQAHVKLGWDRLYLNKWGHRFTTRSKLSQVDKTVAADYIIPGKHPLNDEYRIAMNYADDEFQDKPSTLYSLSVSETHKVKNWHRILTLRYLSEKFKDLDYVNESSHFLLPSIELIKTKNNNNLTSPKPTDGYRLKLLLRGGINPLLSDKSFAQATFEGKWLKQLSPIDTLITRTELGVTAPENLEDLPLSIRFFAGGDQSIRGFGYRSLPTQAEECEEGVLGGAYLAVGSIEYNRVIKGPFSLATFIDAGNAFNYLDNLKSQCQVGVGVGIRFSTPIGPVKLDLAKPLTSHTNSWRIHINFGPEL